MSELFEGGDLEDYTGRARRGINDVPSKESIVISGGDKCRILCAFPGDCCCKAALISFESNRK